MLWFIPQEPIVARDGPTQSQEKWALSKSSTWVAVTQTLQPSLSISQAIIRKLNRSGVTRASSSMHIGWWYKAQGVLYALQHYTNPWWIIFNPFLNRDENCHQLVHETNAHNGPGPRSKAKGSIQTSCRSGRNSLTGTMSAASQGLKSGSWSQDPDLGIEPMHTQYRTQTSYTAF